MDPSCLSNNSTRAALLQKARQCRAHLLEVNNSAPGPAPGPGEQVSKFEDPASDCELRLARCSLVQSQLEINTTHVEKVLQARLTGQQRLEYLLSRVHALAILYATSATTTTTDATSLPFVSSFPTFPVLLKSVPDLHVSPAAQSKPTYYLEYLQAEAERQVLAHALSDLCSSLAQRDEQLLTLQHAQRQHASDTARRAEEHAILVAELRHTLATHQRQRARREADLNEQSVILTASLKDQLERLADGLFAFKTLLSPLVNESILHLPKENDRVSHDEIRPISILAVSATELRLNTRSFCEALLPLVHPETTDKISTASFIPSTLSESCENNRVSSETRMFQTSISEGQDALLTHRDNGENSRTDLHNLIVGIDRSMITSHHLYVSTESPTIVGES